MAIYETSPDGRPRSLHRQFLRGVDGAVVETFGPLTFASDGESAKEGEGGGAEGGGGEGRTARAQAQAGALFKDAAVRRRIFRGVETA